VNRSPQSQEWRGGGRSHSPDRTADNTIEIQSPEYDQSDAYGNITRSPQSPGSHVEVGRGGGTGGEWEDSDWAADIWENESTNRGRRNSSPFPSPGARGHSPPFSRSPSPIRSPTPPWAPSYPNTPVRSPSPQPGPSHWSSHRRRGPRPTPSPPWSSVTHHLNTASDDILDCPPRSPPASPPRQVHSPVFLVKSPTYPPSLCSPKYQVPSPCSPAYSPLYEKQNSPKFVPRSPSVIDIDFEESDIFGEDTEQIVQNNEDSQEGVEESIDQEADVTNEGLDDPSKNNDQSREEAIVFPDESFEANPERIQTEEIVQRNVSENSEDIENVDPDEMVEQEAEQGADSEPCK